MTRSTVAAEAHYAVPAEVYGSGLRVAMTASSEGTPNVLQAYNASFIQVCLPSADLQTPMYLV